MGLEGVVLLIAWIADRDSAEESILLGNIKFFTDDVIPDRHRTLCAGSEPMSMSRENEIFHHQPRITCGEDS